MKTKIIIISAFCLIGCASAPPQKNTLIEKYDKNGDGKLDREEIQTAEASMTDEEKKKMREMMMKRFRRGPR